MNKTLPATPTTLDLLKTLAVVIMVIDHIGYYFFPENEMLRAVGRIGFPVWFFLIGYARGRDIPAKLWGGALILLGANYVVGMALFPLNALFTIIFIRLLIEYSALIFRNYEMMLLGLFALAALIVPTSFLCEYGTLGLIVALFGYAVRNQPVEDKKAMAPVLLALFSFAVFIIFQQINFDFAFAPLAVMVTGTACIFVILLRLDVRALPVLGDVLPAWAQAFLRLGGRRTLEIYVLHLVVFKLAASWLYPAYFTWFSLSFF